MSIVAQVIVGSNTYDIQAIEYITGTQASATSSWTGTTRSKVLDAGKVIAYKLPYNSGSSNATLQLNFTPSGSSAAAYVLMNGNQNVTDQFEADAVILMMYDGTVWQVLGGSTAEEQEMPFVDTETDNFVSAVSTSTTTSFSGQVNGVTLYLNSTSAVTAVTTTTSPAVTSAAITTTIPAARGVYF